VFPMAIALFIHAHSQCYFPHDSHILRQAIGQPKEAFNGLHLYSSQFDIEILLSKPGSNTGSTVRTESILVSTACEPARWPTGLVWKSVSGAVCWGLERPQRELTKHRRLVPRQLSALHGSGLNCAQEELCCYISTKLYR